MAAEKEIKNVDFTIERLSPYKWVGGFILTAIVHVIIITRHPTLPSLSRIYQDATPRRNILLVLRSCVHFHQCLLLWNYLAPRNIKLKNFESREQWLDTLDARLKAWPMIPCVQGFEGSEEVAREELSCSLKIVFYYGHAMDLGRWKVVSRAILGLPATASLLRVAVHDHLLEADTCTCLDRVVFGVSFYSWPHHCLFADGMDMEMGGNARDKLKWWIEAIEKRDTEAAVAEKGSTSEEVVAKADKKQEIVVVTSTEVPSHHDLEIEGQKQGN
ncbi:uncharacterized protein PAC_10070 [Phialocephala subalpina]|uniref:Uncharacterized protein n=1 Tax=Phialocephala subalpina TaxID=576137 RepID=A0A1L7X580_9HELO|nr:uncharacterized protein PAC_10070 [Phialocephala subalpina]